MTDLVIRAGSLIDGVGDQPQSGMEVVVAGARIVEVRPVGAVPVPVPRDAQIIEEPDGTLMPGMIDLHMHVFQWKQPHDRPGENEPVLEVGLRGIQNASELLDLGVTTARDVASRDNLSIQLRDLIRAGRIRGPRFLASGTQLEATGRPDFTHAGIKVTGVDEARAAARRQLRAGADWIKIMATAGVSNPSWQELSEEELRAATAEAHHAGRRITTHAIGTDGIKAALRAGVDCIEHGNFLDDEAVELMLEHDVGFVPTLIIMKNLAEFGVERRFGNPVAEGAKRALEASLVSVEAAYRAGVRIATGSDVDLDETVAQEVRMLLTAGLPAMAALKATTSTAAGIIGLGDQIGTVQPGRLADLILLDGDPIADPFALDRVTHVIQAGDLVKALR